MARNRTAPMVAVILLRKARRKARVASAATAQNSDGGRAVDAVEEERVFIGIAPEDRQSRR